MSWTSQQVMDNLVAHNACPEGIAWASSKDSDAMWASEDEFAAPYLFWWAVQNVDQIGWPSQSGILRLLSQLIDISEPLVWPHVDDLRHEITIIRQDNFVEDIIRVYLKMESHLKITRVDNLLSFRNKALPLVKKLEMLG
jgi:hypothetical protein